MSPEEIVKNLFCATDTLLERCLRGHFVTHFVWWKGALAFYLLSLFSHVCPLENQNKNNDPLEGIFWHFGHEKGILDGTL